MEQQLVQSIEKVIQKHFSSEYAMHLNRPLIPESSEKKLLDSLHSKDLSSDGAYLTEVENKISNECGVRYVLGTITGTSALHLAIKALGIGPGDEILTTPFSFIATANAIFHSGADPVFLDLEEDHFTMDPERVRKFLGENCTKNSGGQPVNKKTGKPIRAMLPVHVFGGACDLTGLIDIAREFNIDLIEDAAQAFGSTYDQKKLGSFGKAGVFSFNGNKIITSGQGGCLVTNDEAVYHHAKLLANNARVDVGTRRAYFEAGFNYRMANLNAAVLSGELDWIEQKINTRKKYWKDLEKMIEGSGVELLRARPGCRTNYWQTVLRVRNKGQMKSLKKEFKLQGLHYSEAWPLISDQKPYKGFQTDGLIVAREIISEILFLPSSPDLSFKMLPYFRAELVQKGK